MRGAAEVPGDLAGKWVAWNREQTQIIGAADSFDAAKQIAADHGWREVVIAKVPPKWRSYRSQLLVTVAVFIA